MALATVCAECGFLGLRKAYQLIEANEEVRGTGALVPAEHLRCAMLKADLEDEYTDRLNAERILAVESGEAAVRSHIRVRSAFPEEYEEVAPDRASVPPSEYNFTFPAAVARRALDGVLRKERPCEDWFIEWHPGFTPQDHRRMLDQRWRDSHDEQRKASDRRWHVAEMVVQIVAAAVIAVSAALIGRASAPTSPPSAPSTSAGQQSPTPAGSP